MRWLPRKKDSRPEPMIAIESLDGSRPAGREGRLFDLIILSLYLHSAGNVSEMVAMFIDKATQVTEASFVLPFVLDKKRDILTAHALEGIVDPRLERVMEAYQEDISGIELDLPLSHFRYLTLEQGEVVVGDSMEQFRAYTAAMARS